MPTPTILSHIEGTNHFMFTTDIEEQRVWEHGHSFPAGVSNIRDVVTFANVVCCVADMNDGTCAVIRSLDTAKTWETVWTHANKILMMREYDIGWLMLCDDTGAWYHSTQSGYNFSLVTSSGPRARNFVCSNGTRIIAHDGDNLWLSINDAKDWVIKQEVKSKSANDPIRAALAASNTYVLAGVGSKLWRSTDFGESISVSKTFPAGEYIQALSSVDTTTLDSDFLMITHIPALNLNRTYYSPDAGLEWTAKIDTDFNPNAYIHSNHIKVTGEPRTETTALVPAMVTSEFGTKHPKIFRTTNGTNWSNKYVWAE